VVCFAYDVGLLRQVMKASYMQRFLLFLIYRPQEREVFVPSYT